MDRSRAVSRCHNVSATCNGFLLLLFEILDLLEKAILPLAFRPGSHEHAYTLVKREKFMFLFYV